jgi:uncharacterized protein YcbX
MIVDRVNEVNFYPLKSAHAATINGKAPVTLPVGKTGFEVNGVRDRDFVLFDAAENCFVSQRGWNAKRKLLHKMDRRLAAVCLDVQSDHVLVSSSVGQLELANTPAAGRRIRLDIFGKELPVVEQIGDASRYFSALLQREVLLVRSDREYPRILPERYRREGAYNQVAGADGCPFLLVSRTSLIAAHEQSGQAEGTAPIDRYRSNIVAAGNGLGPFGEDFIDTQTKFQIGDIGAWAVKACSRCPIPNNDQESGEIAGGGLRILRGRSGRIFTGEEGVFFGQHLVHANEGLVAVGDPIIIENISPVPNIEFRPTA